MACCVWLTASPVRFGLPRCHGGSTTAVLLHRASASTGVCLPEDACACAHHPQHANHALLVAHQCLHSTMCCMSDMQLCTGIPQPDLATDAIVLWTPALKAYANCRPPLHPFHHCTSSMTNRHAHRTGKTCMTFMPKCGAPTPVGADGVKGLPSGMHTERRWSELRMVYSRHPIQENNRQRCLA